MVNSVHKTDFNRRINDRLQRIVNVLLLNASFIDNIGLLNGKMGIAIFFYHYSRYTGNKIYEDYAGELIDEIYEEINTNTPVDFANGLTGIGWGIEYLVDHNFLDADTDEVLSEIDNVIYRHRLDSQILLDNGNDLFGYGIYYLARLMGHENDEDNLNTLMKKHHLIFLTDECERLLIYKRYLEFNILSLSIGTINSLLWFLLRMYKLGLFPSKISKLLDCLPEYLVFSEIDNNQPSDYFILYSLLQKAIESISEKAIQKKYQIVADTLKTDFDTFNSENSLVNSFSIVNLYELVYVPYINSNTLKQGLFERALYVIDSEENWIQRLENIDKNNVGLTGLAGLGLFLIKMFTEKKVELFTTATGLSYTNSETTTNNG